MKFLIKAFYAIALGLFVGNLGISIYATNCKAGICATTETLTNGTSKMNIYETLGMSHKNAAGETSVMSFISDIVFAATYFIGTVVTAALIVSGLLYVFSGADSGLRSKAKNGVKYALIGLVIVVLSVVIVRAVQFIAQGGS